MSTTFCSGDDSRARRFASRALAGIHSLPLGVQQQQAAAKLLRIQAFGEQVAMEGARGQAAIAPSRDAQRFLVRQSCQEAFHAWLFEHAAQLMSPHDQRVSAVAIPPSLIRIRSRLGDAIERESFIESVVIQHVALEALGYAVLARIDSELDAIGNVFVTLRRLVLAQEQKHFEFGAHWIASAGDDARVHLVAREMTDEAEALLLSIAPLIRELGGDPGEILESMRNSMPLSHEAA